MPSLATLTTLTTLTRLSWLAGGSRARRGAGRTGRPGGRADTRHDRSGTRRRRTRHGPGAGHAGSTGRNIRGRTAVGGYRRRGRGDLADRRTAAGKAVTRNLSRTAVTTPAVAALVATAWLGRWGCGSRVR